MLPQNVERPAVDVSFPILCKFWNEDGVWNAITVHIPVAVCGDTFEEAKENLRMAVDSHFEAHHSLGKEVPVIQELQKIARNYFSVDDIPFGSQMLKMLVAMKNQVVYTSA